MLFQSNIIAIKNQQSLDLITIQINTHFDTCSECHLRLWYFVIYNEYLIYLTNTYSAQSEIRRSKI